MRTEPAIIRGSEFQPMPLQWTWHEDITPVAQYEIVTLDGETLTGSFHNIHGCFYTPIEGGKRVVNFSEIEQIRRAA